MPKIPTMYAPIVRLRRDGRYVLLIGWRKNARGSWDARVVWLQREETRPWKPVDVWVPAKDVEPVEGQDYRRVPRAYGDGPMA